MKKPLVSVIIPTFNRAKLLRQCVKSILEQSYSNLEIIIVDDGSNDNSFNAIKKIKDLRISYFKKKNEGVASARNYGIKKANGKYITFCDDDDLFLKEKIRVQVNFLENNKNLAFCYTNGFIVKNLSKKKFFSHLHQRTFAQLLLENSQILTASVMARLKIVKKIKGFNEELKMCEDYDLWLRMAEKYSFNYIDKVFVLINKHSGNMSADTKSLFKYGVQVKLNTLKRCQKNFPSSVKKKYEVILTYQQGKYYFFENKLREARKNFIQLLLINPFSFKVVIFLVFTFLGQKYFDKIFIPIYQKIKQKRYFKNY